MAEQPLSLSDAELEQAMIRLGHSIDYPPTPDLAQAVRHRIIESSRPRLMSLPLPFASRRALATAALVLLLALTAVLTFSSGARSAVADHLGLRGLLITTEQNVPTPMASPVGEYLQLGNRMRLEEAQSRVPFRILVPSGPTIGEPDETYLSFPPIEGKVSLVYRARPGLPQAHATGVGLLLTEFQGKIEPEFFVKGLGPGTDIVPVIVNGGRGFWIDGEAHVLFYRDASGNIHDESVRLAGNVLIWEQDGLTLRLEADISQEEAMRIAASVR